jgi:Uma2 family endonuclease
MVANVREERITVDDYRRVSELLESAGVPVELEEGRLIKRVSTKAWHSIITGIIHSYLQLHLIIHNLPGIVTGETTGYQAADDDCPEPDVAYCAALDYAPDSPCISEPPALVVEVVSDPNNKCEIERLNQKRSKFLAMGATVLEVWAKERAIRVYVPGQSTPVIEREKLTFAGLPGLEIPLAVVFSKMPATDSE